MIVITFGTFDLLHIGHINILERASKLGDKLIVGISTDKFTFSKKNKYPVYY
jgi:glycerol-3-phosphate cytidylyltransferase